jgi:hypothetical protein
MKGRTYVGTFLTVALALMATVVFNSKSFAADDNDALEKRILKLN